MLQRITTGFKTMLGKVEAEESPVFWLTWVAIHVLLFLCLFVVLSFFFYPARGALEGEVATKILQGHLLPYVDFTSEYPPVALFSFLLPGIFFRSPTGYFFAFTTELLLLDILILYLLTKFSRKLGLKTGRTLSIYTLIIVAFGPLVINRYDLVPATLVLASLAAFVGGKNKLAWAVLALGVGAKFYPVIIAPLFGLYYLRHRQYRRIIEGGLTFAAVLVAISLPWAIMDTQGYLYSLTYHLARGLHSESTYATVLLFGRMLGLVTVEGEFNFGSWNLASPLADSLAHFSTYLTVACLFVAYGFFAWLIWGKPRHRPGERPDPEETSLLLQYSLAATALFLAAAKVFSPQFLAWLCPLLPLVRYRIPYWAIFAVVAVLTQYIFPYNYLNFELFRAGEIITMLVRNALVVLLAVLVVLPVGRATKEPMVLLEKKPAA